MKAWVGQGKSSSVTFSSRWPFRSKGLTESYILRFVVDTCTHCSFKGTRLQSGLRVGLLYCVF